MIRIAVSALTLCVLAACGQAPSTTAALTPSKVGDCETPESGIIRPESPGLPEVKLEGPIMVQMLQSVVDPFNPQGSSIFWSKDNAALLVSDFKGPLYIGEGESLSGRKETMPIGVIYSGCRLD